MAAKEPRLTPQTLKVLSAFDGNLRAEFSGADLMTRTHLASGTLYPILIRLEEAKWLKSYKEKGDPSELGRPLRRYYLLTGAGLRAAQEGVREYRLLGDASWA